VKSKTICRGSSLKAYQKERKRKGMEKGIRRAYCRVLRKKDRERE